jgi:hypothetical protein
MSFITPENAAEVYVTQMQNRLRELIVQMEEHVQQIEDIKAKELLNKSSFVLSGLVNVYDHYLQGHSTPGPDKQT